MTQPEGPLVVAYGGGLNSTAMLAGFVEQGVRPDLILFADTGGEKPKTYAYVAYFSAWLVGKGLPAIITVKNDGMYESLEANCLATKTLPSLAYGWKSCSDKYKIRPQNKFVGQWQPALACWDKGGRVTKAIGYDAGEMRRAKKDEDEKYRFWYPLIEWDWDRKGCLAVLERLAVDPPPKSSCFFCPASRKVEIIALKDDCPDLLERALAIESNAQENLDTVKGLGRRFSWTQFVNGLLPLQMAEEVCETEIPCDCFDEAEAD